MNLIDRFISWAAKLHKGNNMEIAKGKPYGHLKKDIGFDELFGFQRKTKKIKT